MKRIDAALGVIGWIVGAAVSAGTLTYARAFKKALRGR